MSSSWGFWFIYEDCYGSMFILPVLCSAFFSSSVCFCSSSFTPFTPGSSLFIIPPVLIHLNPPLVISIIVMHVHHLLNNLDYCFLDVLELSLGRVMSVFGGFV
ncbi:hypothetical protein CHARACLAT_005214 [Characodon lateralis]|uniref:Uncharacterized protein n=1 Tax=Characodon lateralis TaxID=208331 RepID=A0ABU7EGH4_9TELE|nr:hypothetical protein [Characodon lateralis]